MRQIKNTNIVYFAIGLILGISRGEFYKTDLSSNGVDSNLQSEALEAGITGKCLVMTTEDASRTMNTFLGITESYSKSEIKEAALKNSEYLYMEGYLVNNRLM